MPRSVREDHSDIDVVSSKNRYWETVLDMASRIVESENPAEVLADFVTGLAFRDFPSDADPSDTLRHCADKWSVDINADFDEYEDIEDCYEDDVMETLRHIA